MSRGTKCILIMLAIPLLFALGFYMFAMSVIGRTGSGPIMSPEARKAYEEGPQAECKYSMPCVAVKVIEGDYLIVKDDKGKQHKVRMFGIDAPEMEQPYGEQARKRLAQLLEGRKLTLKYSIYNDDGTIRGYVYDDRGNDVGLTLVRGGYAWHNTYRRYFWHNSYENAMEQARRSRIGLWQLTNKMPISPWDWRDGVRSR